MDTSIMSFVLPASYIKEGKIYRIYFECRNGNLETSVDSDAGRILWKQEPIFTDIFTVENYLTEFFSKYGGRIDYHSEFNLEEDIKRMILAYDNSSLSTWKHPEWNNNGVLKVSENNTLAEMVANSYRDIMNGAIISTLEQMVDKKRSELMKEREKREENEDRR